MELAIDTSTNTASLELSDEGSILAEITWRAGRNHTVELVPHIIHLLQQCKRDIGDVKTVIVAKGPGSFNGLRVGLATAKGLAFALGVPLIGISTLEYAAFPYNQMGLPVCPIQNAGRDEISTALFQTRNGAWECLTEEHITTISDLCSITTQKTIFCGEMSLEHGTLLKEQLGALALLPLGAASYRRAGYLAELGWRRFESGEFDDANTLQPIYLRQPSITTKRKSPF